MIFETSWDDNCPENKRLAKLLLKYKMPATFYLTGKNLNIKETKELIRQGFDIGCHTFTHPMDIKRLSPKQKQAEITAAKKWMEKVLDYEITSFCYPRGRYNDECLRLVQYAGYKEARTTIVLATKFDDPHKKPTTIHWFDRAEYLGKDLLEIAKEYYDKAKAEDTYFHLWGHGWEIEKYNLWESLEEFFKYVTKAT